MLNKIIKWSGIALFLITIPFYFLHVKRIIILASGIAGLLFYLGVGFKPTKKRPLTLSEFIEVFTHFRIALDSEDNVYHALEACAKLSKGMLNEHLINLIETIEHNHTVMPFVEFAKKFNNPFVMHIMIHIYLLVDHGMESSRLWQFNYVFEELIKTNNEQQLRVHTDSYERFNMLLFLGSGVVIITIMINILGMIGGAIGG